MSKNQQKYKDWIKHVYLQREQWKFGPLEDYRNEEGRLHRDDAPAYISPTTIAYYQDGRRHGITCDIWGSNTYYFENVLVPKKYVTHPEDLTFEEVVNHPNTEVRAVGMHVYGFDRMFDEERFQVLEVEKSTNHMLLLYDCGTKNTFEDISFCLVRVFNSTPESDGTRKIYYLKVPPTMKTVREAVAWTFYKDKAEYEPSQET